MTKPTVPEGAKPGLTLRGLSKLIAGLRGDVDALKKAVVRAGATTLDGLRDVEVLYDHWTDLPKHGQALRWDKTRDSKYHGLATFSDPTVVADFFTDEVTGDGTFGIDEYLVDADWEVGRPCLVTATVTFTGGYVDQEVTPPTDPATYVPAPELLVQLVDGDSGHVTALGATLEAAYGSLPLNRSAKTVTVSWLFLRGRPKLQVNLTVSSAAAPGLSGSPELAAIARVTRL